MYIIYHKTEGWIKCTQKRDPDTFTEDELQSMCEAQEDLDPNDRFPTGSLTWVKLDINYLSSTAKLNLSDMTIVEDPEHPVYLSPEETTA
jgi:hypothetical protein